MMIQENITQHKKNKCKWWLLGALIVILIIYNAFWYFASQFVQNKLVDFLARGQKSNSVIACENIGKAGFPLRVGVRCDNFNFRQISSGIELNTHNLKATAPIYALKWASVTVAGPASIKLPNLLSIDADWKELEISGDIDKPIPNKISLISEDLILKTKHLSEQYTPLLSANFLRFEADRIRNNLNIQLFFDKVHLPFTLPKTNTPFPAVEGMARIQLNDTSDIFNNKFTRIADIRERLYDHSGNIERAEIALETGGKMTIHGPYAIDDMGYIDADLDIAVGDINALSLSIKQMFPSEGKNIDTIVFIINSMPKNKQGEPVLKVSIKKGEAKLGYIKLGNIAPL